MSTSLAAQLKKLAVPQTSLLTTQGKTRSSLLFDPREAAKFDRDTFYEIGVSGLDELVKLNPRFEEFHASLFDLTSRSLERSVEDKKSNKKLNKLIRRFLLLLSPYFLLKAAHKALEWLVNRYHIESFNVDDLMSLVLPYHDTRIFVRVLQMIDVSDASSRWHWLHPLQGPGVPLSKTALLNRCATDASFLSFVCKITSDAVKEYNNQDGALSTLLAFHCTTLVGGLEHVRRVNELQMTHILKSLLEGLTSPILDYSAGSYVIVAQLTRRTQLSTQIFHGIVHKVAECYHSRLHSECVLLLVLLYQTQHADKKPTVPARTVERLVHQKWFPESLGKLRKTGVNVLPFLVPLLCDTLSALQSKINDRTEICKFAEQLIENVIDETGAQQVIQTIIESFDVDGLTASETKESQDRENSDIEINDAEEVITWYAGFLESLERRYAESYDNVIRKILGKEDASSKQAKTVRTLLGIMKGGKVPLGGTDLFERIHHPSAIMRVEAMQYIVKNYTSLQDRDKDLVSAAVSARLKDDNAKVVKITLGFSTKVLTELIGNETVLDELTSLAVRCLDEYEDDWSEVAQLLVQHLCSDHLKIDSPLAETRVLLTLLPFLVPFHQKEVDIMLVVLQQQSFINKCKLLFALTEKLRTSQSTGTVGDICSALLYCLSGSEQLLPDIEILLEAAKKTSMENRKPIHALLLLLLLVSALPKEMKPALSRQILDIAVLYVQTFKMVVVKGSSELNDGKTLASCVGAARRGHFPLPAFLHCVMQLTRHTLLPNELMSKERKWWDFEQLDAKKETDPRLALSLTVRVLEVIITGCGVESRRIRMSYARCLKDFFQVHFPDPGLQLKFLCSVCTCPGTEHGAVAWPELRLRCLRLIAALFRQSNQSLSWALSLDETVVPMLLTAVASPIEPIRHAALDCLFILTSSVGASLCSETYLQLLEAIQERREEIMLDADQLPLIMYTTLSPDTAVQSLLKPSQIPQLAAALNALLKCAASPDTPLYIASGLLDILMSVNSVEIVIRLVLLGMRVLSSGHKSHGSLDSYGSAIFRNIIQRVTSDTATSLEQSRCWLFIKSSMLDWKTIILKETGETTFPAILVIQQISRELFEALDESLQRQVLNVLISAATDSELPEVASTAGRVIKKIVLNSKLVAAELEKMSNARATSVVSPCGRVLRSRRNDKETPSPELLTTEAWRHGVTLLEWIQSKKKLQSTELLISPLFFILNKCLEFEEQAPVEYTKQLVLSCLLHCCQKLSLEGTPIDTLQEAFNVEGVVQCIRASQNPQTHHHALLLLAHVAGMMPEQVLHNIMAIFTFMGSSILRQDDAYSFQVISKIVDTIIPILIKASKGVDEHHPEVDSAVCSVLRVFADTVLDVPEHRRLLLYQKLLTSLGPERSLWLLLCLVLEGHVLHGHEEQTQVGRRDRGELPRRQEFALNIARCFPPCIVISSCIKMVKYIQTLPVEKDETTKPQKTQKPTSSLALSLISGLFNVEVHTAKQLRHFRFTICSFLSSLLSSSSFVNQVAALSDDNTQDMEPLYQELIEVMLIHIQTVSRRHDCAPQQTAKYWNVMLGLAYDSLDKVNALLPATMFLLVVRGLLNHKLPTVRRKAMELLNNRLQHQTSVFSLCDHEAFYALLTPLQAVMGSIDTVRAEPDLETNQQVAMISLKLLARQLASEDPARFKQILERVTELVQSEAVQKNLLASVVLCLAELVSSLRAHAISNLNQFMPAVIKVLRSQKELDSPNLVLLSVLTATLKIVETLPHFLSPYLDKLLLEVSIQSAKWQPLTDDSKVLPVLNKLKAIRQKISSTISARVLIPAVGRCYSRLLEHRHFSSLGPLLSVLADSFSTLVSSEFTQLMPELTSFFLSALQFRADCSTLDTDDSVSQNDIGEAERHVVNALVALILKLSESTFRPLYHTLFHWATSTDAHKDRIITFYRLSSSIAECLKGLFVLFAGRLIPNASALLDRINICKTSEDEEDKEEAYEEEKAKLLLQYILQTLQRVFQYDSGQGFINKDRFDALMQPIVDQLENTLGGVDALQSRGTTLLMPCIAQFAVAVADDALWKQLNYQILLKTRHNLPQVRLAALEVLCEMARKLGDDFLPLLPETVPFLAELLEDEEETVETACQKAVQELEEILGEPLKKYF